MEGVAEDRKTMKFATRRRTVVDKMRNVFLRANTDAEKEVMLRLRAAIS